MKKLILGIILIVILFSGCSSQIDQQETDNGLGTGTETDNNGSGTYTSSASGDNSYKQEILFGIVKDMIVYKNELYFLTAGTATEKRGAKVYKYIDETTPPELQLYTSGWNKNAKTNYDCYGRGRINYFKNFAIYNQQLFIGGPCGVLKLNEETGEWIEPNFKFNYRFANKYLEEEGTTIDQIKVINGDLYAVAGYRGIFREPIYEGTDLEFQREYVTSLFKLNGKVWEEVFNPYLSRPYTLGRGTTDIEYYNQTYYVAIGGVLKFLRGDEITKEASKIYKNDEINNGAWFYIENNIDDIEENDLNIAVTDIEPYKNELFVCGQLEKIADDGGLEKEGHVYRLVKEEAHPKGVLYTDEPRIFGYWNLEEVPQYSYCEFMKEDSGKLYVGTTYALKYVDGVPQYSSDIQPLHVYDGESWQAIDLSKAPGLAPYQFISRVTNVQTFNGKLYIAVDVAGYDPNYRVGDKPEPSYPRFYTLDSNGNLEKITWYRKLI